MKRIYIYGFLKETGQKTPALTGLEKSPVYKINYQELNAMVNDIEMEEIDPTRENVLAHTLVQDTLLKSFTILPASFATVADDEEAVRRLLEKNYPALFNELGRLSGKIEVALKIMWDDKAMAEYLENGRQLSRLKDRLSAASPLVAQCLLQEAGKIVESVAQEWKITYAQKIFDHLRTLSVDAKSNKALGVKSLLNASFLITREREAEFKNEVYSLDNKHKGKVNFKYVGPLPPYNFVEAQLLMAE